MEKTKHPYLKQILKTTAKIALIGGITVVAMPYTFGFAAGLFNLMAAGYVAGTATGLAGAYTALKVASKDIVTMHERVKKLQREEHIDEQLEKLDKEIKKIQPKIVPQQGQQIQPQVNTIQEPAKKTTKWKKINPLFWKKARTYDKAA